ncbi:YciI family protein [Pseudonocardia sp. DLS-67]
MRYALLINERPGATDSHDERERAAVTAEYMAFHDDPRVTGGERLQPAETATTVRAAGAEMLLTDGPFADTKEIFGGFFLVDAPDLDSALELAGKVPALRFGGSVEVRPLIDYGR